MNKIKLNGTVRSKKKGFIKVKGNLLKSDNEKQILINRTETSIITNVLPRER